jgi:AcrR family transcriptional regulator
MKCKKDLIIDAAIDLFAEQGFSDTSTAEIAANSHVAQGTVFYHFKSKEGILHEVLHQLLQETIDAHNSIDESSNSGHQCIEQLLRKDLAIVQQHKKKVKTLIRDMSAAQREGDLCRNQLNTFLEHKIALICHFLRKGIADGSIRPLPIVETAWFLDAAFYGVTHVQLLKEIPIPDINEHAIQLCLSALAPSAPPPKHHEV